MYSLVPSRPTGYLIKYNLFTTISELSDLYTKTIRLFTVGRGQAAKEEG